MCHATKTTSRERERWESEVSIIKNLAHDNIVCFIELPGVLSLELERCNHTKLPILSMEYCSKGNLRRLLLEPENTCGLPEREVKVVLLDLTSAVKYLHSKNITHRDIKPENIVLQKCSNRPGNTIYKV